MLLSEFKQYLAYGELSQINIGELIPDNTHLPRLISHINLGLIELHKRFPVKTAEVFIQLVNYISEYTIHSSKAESNMPIGGNRDLFYIKDSIYYPFKDDLLSIITIFNEDGEEIPLNDETLTYSLFTTGHNVIHHPYPENDNAISVLYKCIAPKISLTSADTVDIDIPPQFVEALLNYVTYRSFAAINMNSAEAINYYAKFEAACALINNLGLFSKPNNTNMRLENNGWV